MLPFNPPTNDSHEHMNYLFSMSELVLDQTQRIKQLMTKVSIHLHKTCFTGKYHLSFSNVRVGSGPVAKAEAVDVKCFHSP